jgi:uncharacterized protein (TIGR02996 family)
VNTLDALLAGIAAEPVEETRWLVLADYLEEHDEPDFAAGEGSFWSGFPVGEADWKRQALGSDPFGMNSLAIFLHANWSATRLNWRFETEAFSNRTISQVGRSGQRWNLKLELRTLPVKGLKLFLSDR